MRSRTPMLGTLYASLSGQPKIRLEGGNIRGGLRGSRALAVGSTGHFTSYLGSYMPTIEASVNLIPRKGGGFSDADVTVAKYRQSNVSAVGSTKCRTIQKGGLMPRKLTVSFDACGRNLAKRLCYGASKNSHQLMFAQTHLAVYSPFTLFSYPSPPARAPNWYGCCCHDWLLVCIGSLVYRINRHFSAGMFLLLAIFSDILAINILTIFLPFWGTQSHFRYCLQPNL